ncbi:site-specific integrase [Lentzea sp. NBC_00516]|uniref:tyrosine-type recombinase/integrase n=1 Tax=Lentzea sp. NBC_00516 TaxID=2903582 RepID=UPI002E81658A|nr:site-specific integrase [Lentzea sp. NBC_00516]WUD26301.1 site-specific integrase [Lentzea sp. NBC_00516]
MFSARAGSLGGVDPRGAATFSLCVGSGPLVRLQMPVVGMSSLYTRGWSVLPFWSGTALGDIERIEVKGWVNRTLRSKLADKSARDVFKLFSQIIGEAVDEKLIGSNPCRKLRIVFADSPERPHATTDEVDALAARMHPDDGLLVITAAYTGLRWGELTGLQWIRTHLDSNPRITVDPEFGALHEIGGRKPTLGPPKTPSSARDVHLPPFLVNELLAHRERNPDSRFVFPTRRGLLQRRANFRARAWLPAVSGNEALGWAPLKEGMVFHDLRHTQETWLIEDDVPRVLRLERLGHRRSSTDDRYSHVTEAMISRMLEQLQRRWEVDGGWSWILEGPDEAW